MKQQVTPIAEILCVFLSDKLKSKSDITFLKCNPHTFIFAKTNIEIKNNISINIVQNNKNTINLTLPYYKNINFLSDSMEKITKH